MAISQYLRQSGVLEAIVSSGSGRCPLHSPHTAVSPTPKCMKAEPQYHVFLPLVGFLLGAT